MASIDSTQNSTSKYYLAVVTIDIGTTSTCCGISHAWDSRIKTFLVKKSSEYSHASSILFNARKEFVAFGAKAEDVYFSLVNENKHHDFFFFRGFKRKMQDKMTDDDDFVLDSENGKTLPAAMVYTAVLKHYKKMVQLTLQERPCSGYLDNEVKWILPVPAMWNDKATTLLRQCGIEAGIEDEHLELILEPEATALYAKYHTQTAGACTEQENVTSFFKQGNKFLICDAGGGSADVSIFEVVDDNHMKELYVSSAEDWNSTLVNEEFFRFLEKHIGQNVVQNWKRKFPEDMIQLLYDFQRKMSCTNELCNTFRLQIPCSLREEIAPDILSTLAFTQPTEINEEKENFYIRKDKLQLGKTIVDSFFEHSFYILSSYMKKVLSHPHAKDVKRMILVGGFSQYHVFTSFLKKEFPLIQFYVPKEGSLAVVNGGLIYGHNPNLSCQRITSYTYGCVAVFKNKEGTDTCDADRIPLSKGKFDRVVKIGSPLLKGKPQVVGNYRKVPSANILTLFFYGSTKKDPKNIADKSCFYLGNISMTYTSGKNKEDFQLEFLFGGSIINVCLTDLATSRTENTCISASSRLKANDYLLVAAIDFGTAYTGYAFSARRTYLDAPTQITTKTWNASGGKLQSLKTSTCALFDKRQKFHSFGFEAEDKYTTLLSDNKHEGWFCFRRFKMKLYDQKAIAENIQISSESGDSLPALVVFSAVIQHLKDEIMKEIYTKNLNIHEFGIRWVITVPAIWTNSCKSFMRRCALKAGIANNRLMIALEPEAAAIYTNFTTVKHQISSGFSGNGNSMKYLVCDAGGGTVDITVHEMMDEEGHHVRELYKASGGDWGGTKVDEEMQKFYEKIFGKTVLEKFRKEKLESALDMARDFEMKKRAFKPSPTDVQLKLPRAMKTLFAKLNQNTTIDKKVSEIAELKDQVKIKRDKIIVSSKIFESFFAPSISKICDHIQYILSHPCAEDVRLIFLVGGYAESDILRDTLKNKFPKIDLLVPDNPGLSVLKGAVIFGHEPNLIQERRAKYTYGIECFVPYCEGKHREEYKFEMDGACYCGKIFDRHVRMDSILTIDRYQSTRTYSKGEKELATTIVVYGSTQENPTYVTDEGCFRVGSKLLELENGKTMGASAIEVQMSFSGTEIELTLTCKRTGRVTRVYLENK